MSAEKILQNSPSRSLNPLEVFLRDCIRKHGAMDFATFMDHALCHPQWGYYVTRDPLGQAGDFTTAPEISQMFGEIIGAWVVDVWHKLGQPEKVYLLEVGPGRGTLMSDLLRVASQIPEFASAVHVLMLEASPVLRGKQREVLKAYRAEWLDASVDAPDDAPIIIIGNEFLDTVPMHQVILDKDGQWSQKVVTEDQNGQLLFGWEAIPTELAGFVPRHAKNDEIYEISPKQIEHMKDWASLVLRKGGAVLQIDYGHALTQSGVFLHAIRDHKHIDVLDNVGSADITCNVDFEPLMRVSRKMGLQCVPVVTQGDYLKKLGIELRAKVLSQKDPDSVEAALRRLVDAEQMGTLFKVFCCYHGLSAPPEGF